MARGLTKCQYRCRNCNAVINEIYFEIVKRPCMVKKHSCYNGEFGLCELSGKPKFKEEETDCDIERRDRLRFKSKHINLQATIKNENYLITGYILDISLNEVGIFCEDIKCKLDDIVSLQLQYKENSVNIKNAKIVRIDSNIVALIFINDIEEFILNNMKEFKTGKIIEYKDTEW